MLHKNRMQKEKTDFWKNLSAWSANDVNLGCKDKIKGSRKWSQAYVHKNVSKAIH